MEVRSLNLETWSPKRVLVNEKIKPQTSHKNACDFLLFGLI